MRLWKTITDFFIPKQFADSPIEYRKALILSWSHILFMITVLATAVMNQTFAGDIVFAIPLWANITFLIVSFTIFKKWQNLFISSNLIVLGWFILIAVQIPTTGGVFSDNIVWLIMGPFIAFILLGRGWGLAWLVIAQSVFIGVYLWGKSHPGINKFINNDDYYFMSYSALSFFVFCFLYIYEKGQTRVLIELNEKNLLLEAQKKEISSQSEALKLKDEKLLKSNQDLQNFAYSASHDLKEPLRMIGMYTQLLQKRVKGQLDEHSEEYMYYMTDGVKRMQKLLDDLLLYSRLGKNDQDFKDIDLNQTLLMVIYNLTATIKDTNTTIISSKLPTVSASSTEMMQLFQNMIANAIKFRKSGIQPEITLNYAENESEHLISLADNGIGIKAEYQEKVFNLFTKLHSVSEYEGSGIGLATCKKIVEELSGRMWLTSTEGVGTTFYFSFPKQNRRTKSKSVEQNEMALTH